MPHRLSGQQRCSNNVRSRTTLLSLVLTEPPAANVILCLEQVVC